MEQHINMETKPSFSPTLSPAEQLLGRNLIVAEKDMPFETLADFLIHKTRREDQDDGFYIMNMERTITIYKKWCATFPRIRPYYAIKCNPDPVLVRQLHMLGTGFDCASKGEIDLALSIGCQTKDIIYANPCKKPSHLRHAVKHGISMMTFDSKEELAKIKDICPSSTEILIRFATRIQGCLLDCSQKFGAPIGDCMDILTTAKDLALNVVGVSFHVGSGCYDEMVYEDCIKVAKEIFDQAENLGFSFSILDIGGGFPGKDTEEELFLKMSNVINRGLDEHFPASSGVQIIAEPGRYFACSPFTLITNVFAVKEVDKKLLIDDVDCSVALTDTGPDKGFMYFVDDAVFGSFVPVMAMTNKIEVEPIPLKATSDKVYPSRIWGQCLASIDLIVKCCQLPKLSVGDWLYYKNLGAYSSAIASNFNGFVGLKHTYYYITMETWKKMNWTSRDFRLNALFIDNE